MADDEYMLVRNNKGPLFLLVLLFATTESRAFFFPSDSLPLLPKKKIYITFDDGPNKGTPGVLQLVQRDSVRVSFFIVGGHTVKTPAQRETWKQLQADSNIERCNHGYSHAGGRYTRYYRDPASVVRDIAKNYQILHLKNAVVRMPGRNAWRIGKIWHTDIAASQAAIDSVHKAGFSVMGWDLEWIYDEAERELKTSPEQLLAQMHHMLEAGATRTRDHLVLLAHDQAFQTRAALLMLHQFFMLVKAQPQFELVFATTYPGILPILK